MKKPKITIETAQSIKADIRRYKEFGYIFITPKSIHEKINLKANILHCGSPIVDRILLH